MDTRIRLLEEGCINQIAAGEVIERPCSVVKELVENAIDAEADRIEIAVEANGVPLIRVRDNGFGMSEADVKQAVLPHATSKITGIGDLDALQTLGFRGEALPSIAAIARMELVSRPRESAEGFFLRLEGGKVVEQGAAGSPAGTTVTVRDLFFNTPARLKFLKSAGTEFGLISDMVGRLALSRPDISFTLTHPQRSIFRTPGNGGLLAAIAQIFGSDLARRMLLVEGQSGALAVHGYISPPDLGRSTRHQQTFLVNNRVVRAKVLSQALKDGYRTRLPSGTYPLAVLALSLDPQHFDVNVHPAKLEIRFRDEKTILGFLSETIAKTLSERRPLKAFTYSLEKGRVLEQSGSLQERGSLEERIFSPSPPKPQYVKEESGLFILRSPGQSSLIYPIPGPETEVERERERDNTAERPDPSIEPASREQREEVSREDRKTRNRLFFERLRPLVQLWDTYIIAEGAETLFLVDQHAAHERIRYESLLEQAQRTETVSQPLLAPLTLHLTIQEEQVVLEHISSLREMGFIVEEFGSHTYLLRGVPLGQALDDPEECFYRFIDTVLSKPETPSLSELLERWIFLMACRGSVKASNALNLTEMGALLLRLAETQNPFTCPHGRPIIIEFSRTELEKRFGRT